MSFLISFTPAIHDDTAEQLSDALLAPARLAFGKYVQVDDNSEIPRTLAARVISAMVCILACTLVLPFTLIGIVIHLFSKTHAEKMEKYKEDTAENFQAFYYTS